MQEIQRVVATLKRQLKARGLTYRDVATSLKLSEPSVKRVFSSGRMTVERLAALGALLDLTLAELLQEAAADEPKLRQLTAAQEAELVSDPKLLLVAACALNHWKAADIVAAYRVTEPQCLQRLLRLDRLRVIDLLPGNRVRLNVARDFDWLPDGPIRRFFRSQWERDFLAGNFDGPVEALAFVHGMLTAPASIKFLGKLKRLRQDFAELHEESLAAPLTERHGTGLLFAVREWEPHFFAMLRRQSHSKDVASLRQAAPGRAGEGKQSRRRHVLSQS
jgi:transcriptional regulator with XRE-family HTH domain